MPTRKTSKKTTKKKTKKAVKKASQKTQKKAAKKATKKAAKKATKKASPSKTVATKAKTARKKSPPAKKKPVITRKKAKSRSISTGENPWVEVRQSPIHGKGVFAKNKIPKNTLVGHYEGTRTTKDGTYVLWMDDYGIDGKSDLRFVNHSSKPNAIFEDDELWTLRAIKADEEVTFHYGADWEDVD